MKRKVGEDNWNVNNETKMATERNAQRFVENSLFDDYFN